MISKAVFVRVLMLTALAALAGCGSGDDAPPPGGGQPPPAATAPSVTTQPVSTSVVAGQPATFTVAASGTAPFTYQWRRNGVDIAGATAATYTAPSVAMGDNGVSYSAVITNSAGSVTSATAVLTVTAPAANTDSVALGQTTAFLTAVGQTSLLAAHAVDAQGAPIAGAVTWQSSNPAAVSVDGAGRITAQAIGSALLFAEANGVRSQPVFAVVAEPKPGALVVSDAQVVAIGEPIALAADDTPGVGSRYEVTLSGVATAPAAGTVVLAAGDKPVAGKVVSTRTEAGNLVVLLEIASLPDVLARYDIDWEIDLSKLPVEKIEIDTVANPVAKLGKARSPLHAHAQAQADPPRFEAFSCDGEFTASLLSTTISLTPQLGARLLVQSSRDDPALPPGYGKLALVGSQSLKGSVGIKLNAGFGATVTCIAQAQVKIPVGGFISVLVMPALRLGVGFTLDGSVVAVTGELKVDGTIGATESLGFECSAGGGCTALSDATLIDDFKFTKKVPSVNDMHVELSGQIFAVAGIDAVFGLGLYNAEVVEARVGPKQSFDLAFPDDQAKNIGAASNYDLKLDGVIQPGAALSKAIKKLVGDDNVSLNFKAPYSTPLAESPKGVFTISTTSVAYGKPVDFQLHLNAPLDYPLLGDNGETQYNVNSIRICRKKLEEAEFTEWKSLSASNGQSTWQTSWTPTVDDQGDYEFAAFVETQMPVPLLEVAENSLQRLHVRGPGWHGNVTFTMQGHETETISQGPNNTTVTTFTDNGTGSYELESIPGAEGTGLLSVAQASGTLSKSVVEQYDNAYDFGGCHITVTQTRESFEQGALERLEGAPAVVTFAGDGTYELMIPHMTGDSAVTIRTVASETSTGPDCHAPNPTDRTDHLEGHVSTSILTVKGTVGQDAHALSGTAQVTIEGLPDYVYSVSWTLQE